MRHLLACTCLTLCLISGNVLAQPSFQDTLNDAINETPAENASVVEPQETIAPVTVQENLPTAVEIKDTPAEVMARPETAAPIAEDQATLAPPQFDKMKYAVLQTLDKVTARTSTVTVPIATPTAVGPLFVEVQTCQKAPPTEQPESAGFLQIWEAKPKAQQVDSTKPQSQWVFSGWMFASSPALSAMNHPIYDVWVKDCANEMAPAKSK
jgi:hypothetical protein